MMSASIPATASTNAGLRIGEYYTDDLAGLAFFRRASDAVVLSIGWLDSKGDPVSGYDALMAADPRFGAAAPDDSYHRFDWKVNGVKVRFEWGRAGKTGEVGRVSANGPAIINLDFKGAWGSSPRMSGSGHSLAVSSGDLDLRFVCDGPIAGERISNDPAKLFGDKALCGMGCRKTFAIGKDSPLSFWMGAGAAVHLDRTSVSLKRAAARYSRSRVTADGDYGNFLAPITNELGHSRVFSPDNGRIAHTVSRRWCLPDGQVLFCWDSFFNGLLASVENPAAGRDTVRAVLAGETRDGFVPNFSGRTWGTSVDRSQPPVGSLCVWKMYERDPDKAFLAEVYPKLLRWHRWWLTKRSNGKAMRDGNGDGLLEWGTETSVLQNAKFESGLDDSPMFDTGEMAGPNMELDSTDLSALYAMDADYLGRIAAVLGHHDEAAKLRQEHNQMVRRMNQALWNDAMGVYCYRYWRPRKPRHLFNEMPEFEGEYYQGRNFERPVATRRDAKIDFDFSGKPPISGLDKDNYSIRWTATFTPSHSCEYIFRTSADDGIRVFLDGKKVLDDWSIHGTDFKDSSPTALKAGSAHSLRVEYFQAEGDAVARFWIEEVDESAKPAVFLPRLSPLNFYPMLAGAPSRDRARRMLDLFFRSDKFNGQTICPTISRDDSAYPAQGYWRGTVWGPTSYLFYQGLRRYGTVAERNEFAHKSVAMFMKNWNNDGTCHENFNAITGWGRSDPHYTWGALLCLIALEDLCDIEPNGNLRLNGDSGVTVRIRNFRLGGRMYDLRVEPHRAALYRGGHKVLEARERAAEVLGLP